MKKVQFTKVYKAIKETVKGELLLTKEVKGFTFEFIKHGKFINICHRNVSFWCDGGFKWCTLSDAETALDRISNTDQWMLRIHTFINDGLLLPEKEKVVKESIPMCKYKVCINGVVSTKRKKIIGTFELDGLSFVEVVDSIIYNGYAVSRGSKDGFIYGYETYKFSKEKVEAWIKKEYKL